jgi:hypothetical protein
MATRKLQCFMRGDCNDPVIASTVKTRIYLKFSTKTFEAAPVQDLGAQAVDVLVRLEPVQEGAHALRLAHQRLVEVRSIVAISAR